MKKILLTFHINHKKFWNNKGNLNSLVLALGLVIATSLLQKLADNYLIKLKGIPVSDLLLNLLPTLDIDFFIVQSALILTILTIFLLLYKPKYLIFGLKSYAVFTLIRNFFIILTHLGPSPQQLAFDHNMLNFGLYNILFNTTNDFFFSSHTGIPFLLALIFWPEKPWRYLFLAGSALLGASVLFARLHYSIDVFAAPFMTYSIFVLSKKIFPKDYAQSIEN